MKNFLLFSGICISAISFAQRSTGISDAAVPTVKLIAETNAAMCDTISNVIFGVDSAVVYSNSGTGNWGYISGTNNYKDIAKAEKFSGSSYTPGYQLAGGIFYFYKAVDGANNSMAYLSVWEDDGPNGYPKTLTGCSIVSVNGFQTGMSPTALMFVNPVGVSGDFYFGIGSLQNNTPQDDTVALYTSTKYGTVNTAYEQWIDSSWHAFSEPNNWNIKCRYFIAAILCNTDVGSYEIVNPSEELIVFPNPASDRITIHAGKDFAGSVNTEVYDVSGRLVYKKLSEVNSDSFTLDLGYIGPGIYSVTVEAGHKVLKKSLIIQ